MRLWDSSWTIPYYLDIGTGNSDFTWQGMVGLSYGFNWGEIFINYRYLDYDMDEGGFFEDLSLEGPGVGLTFQF